MSYPVVYQHELVCLMCGRVIVGRSGLPYLVESRESQPPRMYVPREVRCRECGGPPIPSGEVSMRSLRPEPKFTRDELPRVGRPSNAVLAARDAGASLVELAGI